MKKYLALLLALMLTVSLVACGETGTNPSDSQIPPVSSQTDGNSTVTQPSSDSSDTAVPGQITDFAVGVDGVPAEWQKAMGKPLFGMEVSGDEVHSKGYLQKFGGVSADDFAKLLAYFDTLTYTEKLDGVYNCEWGQLQIANNAEYAEMTLTWFVK